MYVYLDDSGNIDNQQGNLYVWAGFSIKSGYGVLADRLDLIMKEFDYNPKSGEVKGSRASYEQRKRIFDCLLEWDNLRICYLVVDKKNITKNQSEFVKGALSRNKEQSENYFLSKVLSRLAEPYSNTDDKKVVVNIDGQASRPDESEIRLHEYLSLRVNFPKWNKEYSWNNFIIKYKQDKNDRLMQAADFIASFVQEYYNYTLYKNTKNRIESAKMLDLYNKLKPAIFHKIYGLPNISLI